MSAAGFYCGWFSAGGFFIKGSLIKSSLGLYLSGGYFNLGGFAAGAAVVCVAALLGAVAATVLYHLIPWRGFFTYLKGRLAAGWDRTKQYASWFWEKLKELGEQAASAFSEANNGGEFEHPKKPRPAV
jgi:hypothetical protein